MADASVVGIFDTLAEAEAASRQVAAGGINARQISVIASSLRGTWTVNGYVRSGAATERSGRFLTVVRGEATETAEAAQILRDGGAARVESFTTLVREFILATPARDGA